MRRVAVFAWPVLVSLATVAAVWLVAGASAATVVAILAVLEISLSFDNAVVNANVLRRMSAFWQGLFLTVGIAVAVVGMRLLFPFLVVTVTTHLSPNKILRMALDEPQQYAAALHTAHPGIAAFGAAFLFMIFLEFVFEEREVSWLSGVERLFSRVGRIGSLSTIVALAAVMLGATALPKELTVTVLISGLLGVSTFLAVGALGKYFEKTGSESNHETQPAAQPGNRSPGSSPAKVVGRAAAALFVYLEILDASFSFDGVIGAFAISSNIFVIAAGLGIGALFVRGLTVFLVREGTLNDYVYLEHGAHYAIGALAVMLGLSIAVDLPEIVTGFVGITIIALAFLSSVGHRREQLRLTSARVDTTGQLAAVDEPTDMGSADMGFAATGQEPATEYDDAARIDATQSRVHEPSGGEPVAVADEATG